MLRVRIPRNDGGLQVAVAWRLRADWRATNALRNAARHAATAEGFTSGTLSIAVVGARAIAGFHEQYLGIAGPTDVLTFDLGTSRADGRIEGEIIVCADVALRMVRSRNRRQTGMSAARAELTLYVVHGILHLAGYDDDTAAAAGRMHAREDELLCELGLGRVFRDGT